MKDLEPMTRMIRPLRSGQITIPAAFRRRLGIGDDTMLRVTLRDGELHIKPVQATERVVDTAWYRDLYEYFAPLREEIAARGISEQEVNDDIDAAVRAVRAEHA